MVPDQVGPGDIFNAPRRVLVTDVGDHRLPTETTFDIRVGKAFKFQRTNFNLDFDVFNLMNSDTVLGRQYEPAARRARPGSTRCSRS